MTGLPSPLIPPEIASHVLEGVDSCDGILRNLFLCMYSFLLEIYCYCIWALVDVCCSSHSFGIGLLGLQINDIEPFCQDEIALYKQCTQRRVRWMIFDLRFLVSCP